MLTILIFIFILIPVLELPTLLRQRHYHALAVFLCFYLVGVYLGLAQFYGWNIYNPIETLLTMLGALPAPSPEILVRWACV